MIWTFILGAIAGYAAPHAEDRLRPHVDEHLPGGTVGDAEMRAISLVFCLLIAAIVAMLTGSDHVLPLVLGVTIGVLGPRLWEKGPGAAGAGLRQLRWTGLIGAQNKRRARRLPQGLAIG